MSDPPQFTLITSTLNSGATLERCLRSVAGQTNASFEHLIADGASSDNTLEIVEHYCQRYPLRLACSTPDTSLYQAWNRGVEQARGQWLLFLGSDDFLISGDILSRVAEAIEADPSLGAYRFLYGDTVDAEEPPDWAIYRPNSWLQRLRGVTEFPTSVFINGQLFQQGNRFDESYRICGDHKFFMEHDLFTHGEYLPVTMISFQQGGISSNRNYERMHYLERSRMLAELNRSRPWYSECYYWLRSHQRNSRPS
ncbi:glycosyltransferase [Synechococcus sp. GFB01]|uniref:glycosyltransferase n=1 Tax=Synechococcus sp. GFB01 TaxID=1662190 RepID=UPI00069E6DC3|nr:glycosyltransferase [Synechococcus sp. GFB01]